MEKASEMLLTTDMKIVDISDKTEQRIHIDNKERKIK